MIQKLDSIRLPAIDFDRAPAWQVVDYIVQQSIIADPRNEGIALGFPVWSDRLKSVTIHLQNPTLREAIHGLSSSTRFSYKIEDDSVHLVICRQSPGALTTRSFKLSQAALMKALQKEDLSSTPPRELKQFFERFGPVFPTGSRVIYNASTELLTVTHEMDVLGQIEVIVPYLEATSNKPLQRNSTQRRIR